MIIFTTLINRLPSLNKLISCLVKEDVSNKIYSYTTYMFGILVKSATTSTQRNYEMHNAATAVNDVKRFVNNNIWSVFGVVPSLLVRAEKKVC